MTSISRLSSRTVSTFIASAAVLFYAAPAFSLGGISLRAGAGEHYQRIELAWESPSFWRYQFSGNKGHLDLVGEFGAAYWRANGSRSPNAWQFNAIPILRWTMNERFYLEAGVGPTVFTRTRVASEEISTALQFGSHIGAGMYVSDSSRIGVRYSHFSNANIKTPNPGLDVLQLTYTYQY